MADDDMLKVLRAVEGGLVQHAHPVTWNCAQDAQHIDARTRQRALQQDLLRVAANSDRAPRPVTLTRAGQARLARE
jgi:hypothetical protein